ncbi:hypothetical protein [Streptomyces mirabilis]|uniref:hypothetical protein n=1 Tax=Streptomyces mirabilis TaxID=68239 RepID=UPI0033A0EBB8
MTAERDASGRAVVHAKVHNTGGRTLDLTGALKMSQVSGTISAGPYPVDSGKSLAPGQSASVDVIVTDQVADGPWNVSLTLKSGLLEVTHGARITYRRGRAWPRQSFHILIKESRCTGDSSGHRRLWSS